MNWLEVLDVLWPFFKLVLSAVEAPLKADAIAALQAEAAKYPSNPIVDGLIAEAEKLVSAA